MLDVTHEFKFGVVRQFVIHVQDNVFFSPFTFHKKIFPYSVLNIWNLEFGPTRSSESVHTFPRQFHCRLPNTEYQVPTTSHRIGANALRNFCVARNSVFLAVSSVVFSISPIVRRRRPW